MDDDDVDEMKYQDERICDRCGLDADPIVSAMIVYGRLLCGRCLRELSASSL